MQPFEFDLSGLTIGDTMVIMRAASGGQEMADTLAVYELLERITVGGIKHLPADAMPVLLDDFVKFFSRTMGNSKD